MNVLFVDERNTGAAQLAAALAERVGLSARSAGLDPATRIDGDVAGLNEAAAGKPMSLALSSADMEWAQVVVWIDCDPAVTLPTEHLAVEWHLPQGVDRAEDLAAQLRRLIVELVMDVARLPVRSRGDIPDVGGAGRRVR